MKIFYAVQATGNGHISRASEILPFLSQYGNVDIFLSGSNYGLKTELPIAYRSKGISLFYDTSNGCIDVLKTLRSIQPRKLLSEARHLPLEKYDLVINDFEPLTSLACKIKGVQCIHFGHQASFRSKKVPRPAEKSAIGEWVLKHYAYGSRSIGLHFLNYDSDIFSPIIKNDILNCDPIDKGHITIYLGHYADDVILNQLKKLKSFSFHLFSSSSSKPYSIENIQVFPLNKDLFTQSMVNSHGVITGGGFETPAEALLLDKKLMVIPMKGQYEQQCNAAALEQLGVTSIVDLDDSFPLHFNGWMNNDKKIEFNLLQGTEEIVQKLFSKSIKLNEKSFVASNQQQQMILEDHFCAG